MKTKIYLFTILFILFELGNTTSAQYVKLLDFENTSTGIYPFYGTLLSDGTYLYGLTSNGGANGKGTIFKIMPDGTGFSKLLDFDGTTTGATPEGSLITDGVFLYGMTDNSGASGFGTIFKILPDGTGFAKLLDFNGQENGRNPHGSLLFDGAYLYGMTTWEV